MTYKKYTKEKLAEKYRVLPQVLKDFLISEKLDMILNEIIKKNNLLLDQAGILENEVVLVVLGDTKAEDFPKRLRRETNIGQEKLNKLIRDVNEKVFKEIRASLREGSASEIKVVNREVIHEPEKKDFLSENIEESKTPTNIPDVKLTETTHLPKEEDRLKITPEKTKPDAGEKKVDPYREPIE